MMWLLTLIVLAVIAWFLFRMFRRNDAAGTAGLDPLDHDRGGLNQPLPGQRAATDGEVHDAARGHVGGHLEEGIVDAPAVDSALEGTDLAGADPAAAGGRPDAASAPTANATRATTGDADMHRVEASVRTQPEPSRDGTGEALDAAAAARAAQETENTGGTGTAVLTGIATAAAAGAAAAGDRTTDDPATGTGARATGARGEGVAHVERTDPTARVNPPDPDTAGSLELEDRDDGDRMRSANVTGGDAGRPAGGGEPATTGGDATSTGVREPARDDARTNAPVGDTNAGAAAREPAGTAATGTRGAAHTATPSDATAPSDRANAPDPDTAGAGALATDRASGARSNLAAGTVTLAVGGATAASGAAVLANGRTAAEQRSAAGGSGDAHDLPSDADRLSGGDTRANVREMMKILNLRDADASRLGLSKDDFARLWQGDAAAPDSLVEDAAARLRRMLG